MPTSGGGGRSTTVHTRAAAAFPPGEPTLTHEWKVRLAPGARGGSTFGCRAKERLVAAWHAVGFWTEAPPEPTLVASVHAQSAVRSGRVVVVAERDEVSPPARVELQVVTVCTRP
jgi:hypothetical protein